MALFRKILASVDSEEGLDAAVDALATMLGASSEASVEVDLVHVIESIPWYARMLMPRPDDFERALKEHWEKRLENLAARLRSSSVKVACQVPQGKPLVELSKAIASGGHSLFIKQRDSGGSAHDLQLLRTIPAPVWLARPPLDAGLGATQPRVLAAVDCTPDPDETDVMNLQFERNPGRAPLNRKILSVAREAANALGAELHVVHAWNVPGEELLRGETWLTAEQIGEFVEGTRRAHAAAFGRLMDELDPPLPSEHRHLIQGFASEAVLDLVERHQFRLVVMGTVVRTGIPGFLIGNTAETVFQEAPCSILAVKPEGFRPPLV